MSIYTINFVRYPKALKITLQGDIFFLCKIVEKFKKYVQLCPMHQSDECFIINTRS